MEDQIKNNIINNIKSIENKLFNKAQLVAVTKMQSFEKIMVAYNYGLRDFGENRVQELMKKYERLPKDIFWHQIGTLQTNKIKYIAPFVHLIHSVTSIQLLEEINKQAFKNNRIINCLLQFYIATEESKSGMVFSDAIDLLKSDRFQQMKNIKICGVMGMASFTDDNEKIKCEFKNLKSYFDTLKSVFFRENADFTIVSMGMSNDFNLAIEQGATMVRIGSDIFK